MKIEKVERSIVFHGQTLADTNPGAPIHEVVRGYATTYPELLTAEVKGPVLTDGKNVYTAETKAAYKG